MNGWIKLHKRIRKHWVWEHPDFLLAWIDMLMMANWKDQKRIYKDEIIFIKRGSFPTSLRKLADRWGFSVNKLNRFIKLLKKDTMIDTHTDYGFTLVKIVNYEQYQVKNDTQTDTVVDTPVDTVGVTTIRSNKKEKKNIYSKESQIKKIEENIEALILEFIGVDVNSEFEKFKDYLIANGKTYKNYNAAFRNWLRSDWVATKQGVKNNKVTLYCPEHKDISVKTDRGTFKFCSKCRLPMKTDTELALERISK